MTYRQRRILFVVIAIALAVALLVLTGDSVAGAVVALVGAGAVGAVAALLVLRPILHRLDRRAEHEIQQGRQSRSGRCARSLSIRLSVPFAVAHEHVRAVLESWEGARLLSDGDGHAAVSARTPPSVWSFGEYVTARVRPVDDQLSEVEIESRPRIPWTITDYGKNKRNVERVRRLLHAVERR